MSGYAATGHYRGKIPEMFCYTDRQNAWIGGAVCDKNPRNVTQFRQNLNQRSINKLMSVYPC